jgi:hypothetical protein
VSNSGGGAYLPAGNERHHRHRERRELELPARKQPEILQQASSGEQREAESLPDGGGVADQAKSRPNGGGAAADQEQSEW